MTGKGSYKENPKEGIVITVSSDTAHQIDPDTGAVIVEVEQPNDEQVGSLTLTKTGEQPVEVKGDSLLAKAKRLAGKIKDAVTGEDTDTGVFHDFVYEESGVEGAAFELYAKDTIYSPDGAKDEQGNPVIRYEKDDLVATLVTDSEGKAVVNNLPLGSYYLKETVAGDHFVLNPEQKEFTLTVEDDTQAVVYEGVAYKNERQKISISVEKKDAVTEEKLEGVIFGLYAKEDILSQQGEVLVEKDTLLEKKATDEKGQLTFDSDLYHGKYYVKEEVRKPGYLPNEEIWEMDASYTDQNLAEIKLTKEVENQPTESQFTKTDATTGEELEGAKLQIIDKEGNIVEEWISAKEPHVVYGLPEGTYILHEELPPYAEGYVSAEDIEFEVKEDGSVTKVEMKDDYSKVEISKTDITTGEELEGAKLQILNKEGEILEEWVTDGKPHLAEKLPVGEELTLREITAPEGYEIAEDVKFTLEDTMEIQKVEMKDARTPETPGVPQTGDDHWKPILLFVLLGASAAGLMATMIYKKKHGKTEKADERKKKSRLWILQVMLCVICIMSAALLYYDFVIIPRQNRELVEDLKSHFPEEFPPGGGSPTQKEEQAGRELEVPAVDFRSLQSQYPDVRGWLTIQESGIDYPVLQSSPEEPEYYLPRDYRGNYDINGSLFLQADCILGESGNLTIYGHNMNSGAMFGNLDQYASYDYWKAHPRVFFQTPGGMEEYRIAAVLKADVSMFDFQRTSFQSPQELEAYVAQAKALSLFETGVDGIGCEKTLTLVTCSYEWKQARNILVAVKTGA